MGRKRRGKFGIIINTASLWITMTNMHLQQSTWNPNAGGGRTPAYVSGSKTPAYSGGLEAPTPGFSAPTPGAGQYQTPAAYATPGGFPETPAAYPETPAADDGPRYE
jgi:transcription elongation factor SPT5